MYRGARAAQVEFEKHQRYLRLFTHGDARAKLGKAGPDYLQPADALLERLEVKAASGNPTQRRKRIAAWATTPSATGPPIHLPQQTLDAKGLTHNTHRPTDRSSEAG